MVVVIILSNKILTLTNYYYVFKIEIKRKLERNEG